MKSAIRLFANALTAMMLAICLLAPALAQSLANRPVRLLVPYSTGGPVDVSARILAEAISPLLGVPVVVETRPGAGGKIAAEIVARAEPDGHTLMYGGNTQYVVLPLLDKSFNFKTFEFFISILFLGKCFFLFRFFRFFLKIVCSNKSH